MMTEKIKKFEDKIKEKIKNNEEISLIDPEFDGEQFSEDFILQFHDKLPLQDVLYFQKLSEETLSKLFEISDDKFILMDTPFNQNLSETFIEKFKDKIDWYGVCNNQKLSEDFIRKYQDKVDWETISYRQKLSEEFIEEFSHKLDWQCISEEQNLSKEFIIKHFNKLDTDSLFINKNFKLVPISYIMKYNDDVIQVDDIKFDISKYYH